MPSSTLLSALSYLGLSKEAAWGTPVTAAKWLPVKSMSPVDDIKTIIDEGKRGLAAKDFGVLQGVRLANLDYGGDFFVDVVPYLILAILGKDTVTGTAPYTHLFQLDPAPPSLTFQDYNGFNERQFAGARLSELGLKFASDTGALEWTAKALSKVSAAVVKTTPTFGTTAPLLGWQAALAVGGTPVTKLLAFELNIKRVLKEIFGANNSQDPSNIFAGIVEVTGKLTFDMQDDVELTHYLSNDEPAVVITLTQSPNVNLIITLTKCAFEKAQSDRSQEFVRLDAQVRGIYNVTDAGPCQVAVKNAVATY
jgi:hypothetical protein